MTPRERHDPRLKELVIPKGSYLLDEDRTNSSSKRDSEDGTGVPDDDYLVDDNNDDKGDDKGDDNNGDGLPPQDSRTQRKNRPADSQETDNLDDSASNGRDSGPNAISRLYSGQTSFDFVGRRRWWYVISTIIILAGLASIFARGGLNFGIAFKGGTSWTTISAPGVSQAEALHAVQKAGLTTPTVQLLGTGSNQKIQVQADLSSLSPAASKAVDHRVTAVLAKLSHGSLNSVSITQVGPTWGGQVTQKAITALIIFFVVVGLYISFRFEPKMAIAAFIAMLHDILVTVGIYSLFNFQVTPDTFVAVLTILGYSLYDTVVVFDRVRDNAKGIASTGRMTYTQMVNLSMNQTLARSINTSLVAILPVLSILLIGAQLLGASTLQDYGLALFVGLMSGAYSSIFIASPILASLKEREVRYATIRKRLETRGDRTGLLTPAAAAVLGASGTGSPSGAPNARRGAPSRQGGAIRPGTAKATKANTAAKAQGRPGPSVSDPAKSQAAKSTTATKGASGAKGAKGATGATSSGIATATLKRPSTSSAALDTPSPARRPTQTPRKRSNGSKSKKRR